MKKLIILCLYIVIKPSFGQSWIKTFGGDYQDAGYSVQQTTDGGYIITGKIDHFQNEDVWLIKTDANGDSLWSRTFGGSKNDRGWSVQQTTDGGYIIAGDTRSNEYNDYDIWLIKTDANGDSLWSRTFGGSAFDFSFSVRQTTDGGYILAGRTKSFGSGHYDIWLIKTDKDGSSEWSKTHGGSESDGSVEVQQTTDGGYILIGWTYSFGISGTRDVWLIKTNENGSSEWTKTFSRSSQDIGLSVKQTTDGGYIIVGKTQIDFHTTDAWLIKTDANGDSLWTKIFGGDRVDVADDVLEAVDGGYVFVGHSNTSLMGQVWLVKTDVNGKSIYEKTYGGINSDSGHSFQQTKDGGYIIIGSTKSYRDKKEGDIFLVKVDSEGKLSTNTSIAELPNKFSLQQNYPNPFNPTTTLRFDLPEVSDATVTIYNMLGQKVRTFNMNDTPAGYHSIKWDATNDYGDPVGAGVYLYQLRANKFVKTKKMVLLK